MSLYILKTFPGSFRSFLSLPKVDYVHFNNFRKKKFLIQQWRSFYQSRSNPKILKLKSVYFNNIRNKTADFNATIFAFCIIPNKLFGRSISTMDNETEVPHTSQHDIDNAGKDADIFEVTPEEDTTREEIHAEERTAKQTLPDGISSKNIGNADEACEDEEKKYKKAKKKAASTSAPMSKRALRKWKRQQKKGIEETGPLTTNPDPGYGSDVLSETEYYFEDGLRKVYPYFHTFTSYVKGRWLGRTVWDVFTKEFHVSTEENLLQDINSGLLRVNDKIVTADYKLKFNDLMSHRIHRHENPVIGTKLEIIEDNEHVIVINKPSSIPCHPCGRYRYNSIVFILGKEYGYTNLRNIYRLDRLTSGVLICAKTSEKTRELEDQILNKLVQKEYVCRVVGKFPDEVEVDQPLECINHKISLWQVRESGKPSKTLFKRLSYNGTTSVVQCFPLTGRTHQIRVHLQYLGHPIINDPLYSGDFWGPEAAKGKIFKCEIDEKKVGEEVIKNHNIGLWEKGPHPLFQTRLQQVKEEAARTKAAASTNLVNISDEEEETKSTKDGADHKEATEPPLKRFKMNDEDKMEESRPSFDLQKWIPNENCIHCKTEYIDPEPKDLIMYLHALSYKGPDWKYQTSLPDWAQPNWQGEH